MDETSNSLLKRLGDDQQRDAWSVFLDCYTPFLRAVLMSRGLHLSELDDVMQNVLAVVVRRVPDFKRQRTGSFRTWLRSICANCLREHFRRMQQDRKAMMSGGSGIAEIIQELEDASSDLSRYWDAEHDQYVLKQLLQRVEHEFQPRTYQAFQMLAVDDSPVDEVAEKLGMSVNAAFVARSRVLKRLREIAAGMID